MRKGRARQSFQQVHHCGIDQRAGHGLASSSPPTRPSPPTMALIFALIPQASFSPICNARLLVGISIPTVCVAAAGFMVRITGAFVSTLLVLFAITLGCSQNKPLDRAAKLEKQGHADEALQIYQSQLGRTPEYDKGRQAELQFRMGECLLV